MSLHLEEREFHVFINLYTELLLFSGKRNGSIPQNMTMQKFRNLPVSKKSELREGMYESDDVFKAFLSQNEKKISKEEAGLVAGFNDYERGVFYVVGKTKEFFHLLGEKYTYGVKAISPSSRDLLEGDYPLMINTVLLPFQDKIICDGLVSYYNLIFGKNTSASLKSQAAGSTAKFGIIQSLPAIPQKIDVKEQNERLLLSWMKTKRMFEYNEYEIYNLVDENPYLRPLFNKEQGRHNSRGKKKVLRELGIKSTYFALFKDTIITSAKNRKELQLNIKNMKLEEDLVDSLFIFKI